MLIVKITEKQNLDKALKVLKSKVIRTKQNEFLRDRKTFVKKSVKRRSEILNAIYKNKIKESH